MLQQSALIFAADIKAQSLLDAFGAAGPRKAVALIIDGQGRENVEQIKNQVKWMTKSFNSIELKRDFDLVLDTVRELIQNHMDAGYTVYVSISSSFPEISAALYAATMYKGGIPLAPGSPNMQLPMLRVLMLPKIPLYILKVLHRDFNGIAIQQDLSGRVIETLRREENIQRKSGSALVNYYINKTLKPLGLVRTWTEGKNLKIELTNAGLAVARRVEDYIKLLPKKEKKEKGEKGVTRKKASLVLVR